MRPEIQFLKPLGFSDYNALQMNSYAVLSDSGTISEESSILNFPALNIREAHERPEAMEEASVMMVGLSPERIMQGLEQVKIQERGESRNFRLVSDYAMPNVSQKMVRIIISYTDYIKRVVWERIRAEIYPVNLLNVLPADIKSRRDFYLVWFKLHILFVNNVWKNQKSIDYQSLLLERKVYICTNFFIVLPTF